jgi:hypothetical protein
MQGQGLSMEDTCLQNKEHQDFHGTILLLFVYYYLLLADFPLFVVVYLILMFLNYIAGQETSLWA